MTQTIPKLTLQNFEPRRELVLVSPNAAPAHDFVLGGGGLEMDRPLPLRSMADGKPLSFLDRQIMWDRLIAVVENRRKA